MPTYSYKCKNEGHPYEEIRGMLDEQIESSCPICGSELVRVFSAPPVNFKGLGFNSKSV
jgi:putative FmdB family regulatory protein